MVALDLAELSVREANERIREAGAAGDDVEILNPDARHHISVGLIHPITVRVRRKWAPVISGGNGQGII